MKHDHRILLAPLDWGLGHTTRIIPVGKELLRQGANLILAGTPTQLSILSESFPNSECLPLEGYQVRYGKYLPASWHVIQQFPRLVRVIRQEQEWIARIVPQHQITRIISDNRYGLYHHDCKNVMLMHQFVPPLSGISTVLRPFLWQAHTTFLRQFDQIWIPDINNTHSLGEQMRPTHLPPESHFIGWLSRLEGIDGQDSKLIQSDMGRPDLLVLLSGPEPQRSILEQKVSIQMAGLGLNCWVVQGTPAESILPKKIPGGWLIPYMNASDLAHWLPQAKVVMARSGYSSLMDFALLGLRQIILVPTPGQPEQKLLGKYLYRNRTAYSVSQYSLSLHKALSAVADFHGFEKYSDSKNLLAEVVESWLT